MRKGKVLPETMNGFSQYPPRHPLAMPLAFEFAAQIMT
jgi:hypothetical protein